MFFIFKIFIFSTIFGTFERRLTWVLRYSNIFKCFKISEFSIFSNYRKCSFVAQSGSLIAVATVQPNAIVLSCVRGVQKSLPANGTVITFAQLNAIVHAPPNGLHGTVMHWLIAYGCNALQGTNSSSGRWHFTSGVWNIAVNFSVTKASHIKRWIQAVPSGDKSKDRRREWKAWGIRPDNKNPLNLLVRVTCWGQPGDDQKGLVVLV
jgi:hypothetical protein